MWFALLALCFLRGRVLLTPEEVRDTDLDESLQPMSPWKWALGVWLATAGPIWVMALIYGIPIFSDPSSAAFYLDWIENNTDVSLSAAAAELTVITIFMFAQPWVLIHLRNKLVLLAPNRAGRFLKIYGWFAFCWLLLATGVSTFRLWLTVLGVDVPG